MRERGAFGFVSFACPDKTPHQIRSPVGEHTALVVVRFVLVGCLSLERGEVLVGCLAASCLGRRSSTSSSPLKVKIRALPFEVGSPVITSSDAEVGGRRRSLLIIKTNTHNELEAERAQWNRCGRKGTLAMLSSQQCSLRKG